MKTMLRYLAALAIPALSIVQAQSAHAWTTHIDCEGGPAGSQVLQGGPNTFTNSFQNTVYSAAQAFTGKQSCQMGIAQGTDGWGTWGGTYTFPTHLAVGSQLWFRLSLYVPQGFNYTGSPLLKFMRVHTASPANSNMGYLDFYITPPTGTIWDMVLKLDVSVPYEFYYENNPVVRGLGLRPLNNIAFGQWETYEVYYNLDTVSKNAGGKGEIRIWKNNQLLADLTDQITLGDAATYAESFFLFTYWNGNAPATQSLYVDDITVTSDTPTNRDTNGFPFIGAPLRGPVPNPPTAVSAQ